MTAKLFYEDSHLTQFEAVVVSCEESKKGYEVVLDQTAFFPEGGGQYADTGVLLVKDVQCVTLEDKQSDYADIQVSQSVKVLDAHERQGIIYHATDKPLEVGTKVCGQIDWEERFEKMQQHSGEHIISGLVNAKFGYNNVGFHLGSDYCTMDFDGPLTKEELKEIELLANQAVFKNLDVQVSYPSKDVLADMEYRSKIEIDGQVRIVTIPGYDMCACCAPHVKKTGEIGLIKLVNMINYKGGERITMLCGFRALRDYDKKDENSKAISNLLCAKELEIAEAVEQLKADQSSLKGKVASLQQKMMEYQAKDISVEKEIVTVFDSELSGNAPRELMNLLLEKGAKICVVFAGTDEVGYRYVMGSRTEDVRPLSKKLNELFNGRGGGKPGMVQGTLGGSKAEIRKFCEKR